MPIVLKSGSLNLLEPSGIVQACNGIALPLQCNEATTDGITVMTVWHQRCNNKMIKKKCERKSSTIWEYNFLRRVIWYRITYFIAKIQSINDKFWTPSTYMTFWQKTFLIIVRLFSTFTYATASFIGPSKSSFSLSTIFTRFNFSFRSSFNCSTSAVIFSKGSYTWQNTVHS